MNFQIYPILTNRRFLMLLLWVNIIGTIYGYYWYGSQLKETPAIFLLFVPDSPTACLFFVLVLIAFLRGKNWPYMEALALITLFKYGIWAFVMNILVLVVTGDLHWTGYMLMASHLAMAVQGLLYAPFYRFKLKHWLVAAIVVLHNEIIDYVFEMMPNYGSLNLYIKEVGYFTFWLSIASLAVAYYFVIRKGRLILHLAVPKEK